MSNVFWDQSRLDAAIAERVKFPGRTEAQIVNTAAFWIAVNAKNGMPHVPVERIDTELNVAVNLKVSRRDGTFRRGTKFQRENRSFGAVGNLAKVEKYRAVPLVVLIAVARAKPGSNYNQRTNNRWAIDRNPFKGVSREEGRRGMLALTRRMFAARRSSTHFLMSGWVAAVRTLRPFSVNKLRAGSTPPLDGEKFDYGFAKRGAAQPATEGSWIVFAVIENATGMAGSLNAANYNQALMLYGAPALQRALDIEASLMEQYIEKAYAKENARFNAMSR